MNPAHQALADASNIRTFHRRPVALKPTPSADWKETVREDTKIKASAPPLLLLSDDASAQRLEQIIASMDGPLIDAMI